MAAPRLFSTPCRLSSRQIWPGASSLLLASRDVGLSSSFSLRSFTSCCAWRLTASPVSRLAPPAIPKPPRNAPKLQPTLNAGGGGGGGGGVSRRTIPRATRITSPASQQQQQQQQIQLPESRIREIFGSTTITVNEGNRILNYVYAAQSSDPESTRKFAGPLEVKAAEWLRLQAEALKELEELEKEDEPYVIQSRTEQSAFERIREEAEKKREEERKAREARGEPEPMSKAEERALTLAKMRSGEIAKPEPPAWVAKYRDSAATFQGDDIPQMSIISRLLPSAIFVLIITALSVLYAQNYPSVPASSRLFPSIPPAAATVLGIMALNVAVFVAWRIPPLWKTLNKYFISVPAYPYAASMLGNVFSHQSISHLAVNMIMLWVFGTRLHDDIGRPAFLALFLSSGAFSSFLSLTSSVVRASLYTTSLGASGGVISLVSAYCMLHPTSSFIPFFLPQPAPDAKFDYSISAPMLLALLFATEVIGIIRGWKKVDHYAHLGGYFGGIMWGSQLKKIMDEKRRQREMERRGWMGGLFDGKGKR